jgi:hypothetical protein
MRTNPGARENARPGIDRLLAGLTREQAQAVTHGTGPLLILAGPGAGKTARSPTAPPTCSPVAMLSRGRSSRSRSASAPPANCGSDSRICSASPSLGP